MSNSQANTQVALLYQTQELGRHLRDALNSLGTPIVYEAATDHLDPGALQQSGARVVIVNLDPEVEAHLDEVYGLLEDDRYSVVFNDAQVSSALSGWDQARWARHLAAKILGDADIDPPRPEGAEAIPTPVPVAAEARVDSASLAHESEGEETLADEIEMVSEPEAGYDTRLQSIVDSTLDEHVAAKDAGDPLDMLESRYDEMNQPAAAAYPSPPPPPDDEFDFSTLEALTATPTPPTEAASAFTDEFSEDESSAQPPSFAKETPPAQEMTDDLVSRVDEAPAESLETDPDLEVFDLDALDKLFGDDATEVSSATSVPTHSEEASIDVGDLGDLGDFGNLDAIPTDTATPPAKTTADKPADIAHLSLLDDVAFDAPTAPAPNEASIPVSPLRLAAAADWSLEDMLEGDAPPAVPAPTGRAEFGIEKVSAAEYLAPTSENTAPPPPMPDLSEFSLELMPLEEAVAPQAIEREAHESWLDPDKVVVPPKIRRIWVLGASIGGPEAVRAFLGELPRDYPALFLLAQHMGAEFVDLMAQQLAKATSLTVRTPTHGERVGHGEVIIVPTTHRLQVDPEGFVVLERAGNDGAYSPSIDRVLHDVADRYGANAGAIIFSGMTTDAVDGAKYLAGKGGTVYAQHPDSCVVSSMVDGVVEAGVVKVLGTPTELADVLLAEHTKNKR